MHIVTNRYSAVIEHTNQVIYLEDDDVASVCNGQLNIHRMKMNNSNIRELKTLKLELEQIMKGGSYCPLTEWVVH